MSPYRTKQMNEYLAAGWGAFRVVNSLNDIRKINQVQGHLVPEDKRGDYTVCVRPSSGGRWGKSVAIRYCLTSDLDKVIK
jgi:hypothetical protein